MPVRVSEGEARRSQECVVIDRLDHVGVETGLSAIGGGPRPAPSRSGPPASCPCPTAARGCGGTPRSRSAPASRCRAAPRRDGVARPLRSPQGRRGPCASRGRSAAAAWRATRRRPRCRRRPGCDGHRRHRRRPRPPVPPAPAVRPGSAGGPRTRCRGRGPSLCASTVPPCISTSVFTSVRPMPRPSRERSSDVSTCVNISKTRGSFSAAMPMPLSLTRITACVALALDGQPDVTARR